MHGNQVSGKRRKKVLLGLFFVVLLFVCTVLIIMGIGSIRRRQAFQNNRERVLEYVSNHYGLECSLVKHRIGNYAYPADRQMDAFVFYEPLQNKYFKIFCNDDGEIVDWYEYATSEEPDSND